MATTHNFNFSGISKAEADSLFAIDCENKVALVKGEIIPLSEINVNHEILQKVSTQEAFMLAVEATNAANRRLMLQLAEQHT